MSKTKTIRRSPNNAKAYKLLSFARQHSVSAAILPDDDGISVLIPWEDRSGVSGFDAVECRSWNELRDALGY